MRSEFLLRHRVSLASTVVVALAVLAVVLYALAVPGYASHKAEINDGGVWVTKGESGQFGRLNKPIDQLDGYAYTLTGTSDLDIDVLQDGAAVVGVNRSEGELYPIDVSAMSVVSTAKVPLPPDAQVAMAGGTVAVLDPAKGEVRAVSVVRDAQITDLAGLAATKPLASVGPGSALTVTQDGAVLAVSAGKLVTIDRSGAGFARPSTSTLDTPSGATLTATAVGDAPVVLAVTGATARVLLPGGRTAEIPDPAGAVLQQAGPGADDVLVATDSALVSVPLGGGAARTLSGDGTGTPAAPVLLRGCAFAAWAGSPGAFATGCGGATPKAAPLSQASSDLVFRINRGQVMLNDRRSGLVWNIDTGNPQQVANWKDITKPRTDDKKKSKSRSTTTTSARSQPPKAKDDTDLGARPGRTTSLYVLDNDNDPSGEVLAIESIEPSASQAKLLSISPDGQTVDLRLPANYGEAVRFKYTVRNSSGRTSAADVDVAIRTPQQNEPPAQRANPSKHVTSVPVGGTVTVPVLGDWRDRADGDPIVLAGAKASAGTVSTTPDGQVVLRAPAEAGKQTIVYQVSDGMGKTVPGKVAVDVQRSGATAVPAVAQPDYVRGQVGRPITISPLANDLPGSDPATPSASMVLAGKVASPAGAPVTTDPITGTVTVTPSTTKSLTLNYQVGYGYAAPAKGVIVVRVDGKGAVKPPLTSPDVAVLHGQAPVTVDVLANDSDPAGNLLVVQRVTAAYPDQLEVAVIDGRYVRLRASGGDALSPSVQTVDYTVTDGVTGQVSGSITVTQLPATDDGPITVDDYATVRGGQSVAVPVLDNDSSPSGNTLTLSRNVSGAPAAGQLPVEGRGAAYASGRLVRFVAPVVKDSTTVTVRYDALDGTKRQSGTLQVTVTPPRSATNPNQPPEPQPVEGRAVAGQTVRIKVPTSGVDPDGDTVTVTGLGSAATLGRVLGITASGIEYQAYPFVGNGGTDSFSYVVTDTYGASATGTVRVAVVTPGDPQPPVAANDTLTAAPGAQVQVDVLANDLVAAGDRVTIEPLARTDKAVADGVVKLGSDKRSITVTADDPKHAVEFFYTITNGLQSSRAQVVVRAVAGTNLPPIAFDQYARPKANAKTVDVQLTKGDYDPDSGDRPTVVSPRSTGGVATVTLTGYPQAIPYVIRDADGATATAVVYVPASGAGAPTLRPGASIAIGSGKQLTADIAKYVVDPAGKTVHVTTKRSITASPSGKLSAAPGSGGMAVQLTSAKGYNGPAAVNFEVTNGALGDPKADTTFISIPVQVGRAMPVLRCPSTPLELVEGGAPVTLRPATYCHAWTPNPADAAGLPFTASWAKKPAGVTVSGSGTSLSLVAASGANGSSGTLTVKAQGASSTVAVVVVKAPPLTVSPLTVDGAEAGRPKTVDLTSSLQSPLGAPVFSVVGTPTQLSGDRAAVTASGARVTITPPKDSKGTMRFRYVATDVRDTSRTDRRVVGAISLNVLGHPDAPTGVQPDRTVLSKTVVLRWNQPDDNGSPITRYVATYAGGTKECGVSTSCRISNLKNGRAYTFTVTAYNAVGKSPASAPSGSATPDAVPARVGGFKGSNPRTGVLTFTWSRVTGDFSTTGDFYYLIRYQGGSKRVAGVGSTSTTIGGLDDTKSDYGFQILAHNNKGDGPVSNAGGETQSAGAPAVPGKPTATPDDNASNNKRVLTLSWEPVDPQGRGPTQYLVHRTGGSGPRDVCSWISATSCVDPDIELDGTVYSYTVQARNDAGRRGLSGHTSRPSAATTSEAASAPDAIGQATLTPTGNDSEATLAFHAPASHGRDSLITCTISGTTCGGWSSNGERFATAGEDVSRTITGFQNGSPQAVVLKQCNGSSGSNNSTSCGAEKTSDSVVTYGPIKDVSVSNVNVNGTHVVWDANFNPNGKSATVVVRLDGGEIDRFQSGVGADGRHYDRDVGYSHSGTVSIEVSDGGRDTRGDSKGYPKTQDPPPPPQFQITHGRAGSCSYINSTCELVYVRILYFGAGGKATCSATGVGAKNWGPAYLTAGSDGNSDFVNKDSQSRQVFDTSGSRFPDGTFAKGADGGGLTCG